MYKVVAMVTVEKSIIRFLIHSIIFQPFFLKSRTAEHTIQFDRAKTDCLEIMKGCYGNEYLRDYEESHEIHGGKGTGALEREGLSQNCFMQSLQRWHRV